MIMANEKEKFLLKDHLFSNDKVVFLAGLIKAVYPKINNGQFISDVLKKFPELELKERMAWVSEVMKKHLPGNYSESLKILTNSLNNETLEGDFIFLSYPDFVEKNGCIETHLAESFNALGEFTKFCSSEFAIRRFINEFPEQTYAKMMEWSESDNFHQRRLASEGFRPKLPWAQSINFDYKKSLNVLDKLFSDSERYVTRSVANHLNDISKIDVDLVLEKLNAWKASGKQDEKEMDYIIQHALRTSIKRGEVNTLIFLGYSPEPKISVHSLKIKKKSIALGERLEYSFEILAEANENLIVDYKIIYPSATSKKSEKVFKIKKATLKAGDTIVIEKRHPFKQMTTKKLYSGEHTLEIQINGKTFASESFNLNV